MLDPSPPSTERFSNRVADYVKARPGYRDELVAKLRSLGALPDGATVADIGSGTGISADLLLRNGCKVVAVEPNAAMRAAAEDRLGANPAFRSVAGTAEATTLPDASVDMVFAAQAFHWFEPAAAHREFTRILRPAPRDGASDGDRAPVVLLWNDRRLEGTPFLVDYEALLQRFATDYNQVNHRRIDDEAVRRFFGGAEVESFTLRNDQVLDREGLRARLRSSSYVPALGGPRHEEMIAALDAIFDARAVDGLVVIEYDLRVWIGWLAPRHASHSQRHGADAPSNPPRSMP